MWVRNSLRLNDYCNVHAELPTLTNIFFGSNLISGSSLAKSEPQSVVAEFVLLLPNTRPTSVECMALRSAF